MNHATPADYATWAGTEGPANITQLLRSASAMVSRVTRGALYDTDSAGKPVAGSEAQEAMRDATCAQAEHWVTLGVDPRKGAADDSVQVAASKTINGATVTYVANPDRVKAQAESAVKMCQEAYDLLTIAGLTGGPARTGA